MQVVVWNTTHMPIERHMCESLPGTLVSGSNPTDPYDTSSFSRSRISLDGVGQRASSITAKTHRHDSMRETPTHNTRPWEDKILYIADNVPSWSLPTHLDSLNAPSHPSKRANSQLQSWTDVNKKAKRQVVIHLRNTEPTQMWPTCDNWTHTVLLSLFPFVTPPTPSDPCAQG
jgi:hypothetical protein